MIARISVPNICGEVPWFVNGLVRRGVEPERGTEALSPGLAGAVP